MTDDRAMGESYDDHCIIVPNRPRPIEFSLLHVALDRMHFAMETMIGIPAWGEARDIMAAILKGNGSQPPFHVAINSAVAILHGSLKHLPAPVLIMALNAAWIWVVFSSRDVVHDQ